MAQVGDIGTVIRYNAQESLDDETTLELKYRKPDGSTGKWTATVYSSDYAEYTTLTAADLDMAGTWWIQIYFTSTTWSGHSNLQKLEVERNV